MADTSLRDVAECLGFGDSFSVVGNMLGLRRLESFSRDQSGQPVVGLAPGVPLPLRRNRTGAVSEFALSLREQADAMLHHAFNLNIHVVWPASLLPARAGSVVYQDSPILGPPAVTSADDVVMPAEFIRRITAGLWIARRLWARPSPDHGGSPIGVRRVRWFNTTMPGASLGPQGGDTIEVLDALDTLLDKQRIRFEKSVANRRALNVFFVPALGNGNFGIAGVATCAPAPPASALLAGGAVLAGATLGWLKGTPFGLLLGIGAGIAAAVINAPAAAVAIGEVGGTWAADFQIGKTLVHEVGHLVWLNMGHWSEKYDAFLTEVEEDELSSRTTGWIMAGGKPKFDPTTNQLDMFLTADDRSSFVEHSCTNTCTGR